MTPRLISCALLAVVACGAEEPMTEEQKTARIESLYAGYREAFPQVQEITAEDLAERLRAGPGPVIVDVRTGAERAVSMIPGSMPKGEFEARREELRDRAVVTYCTIGYRSGLYAEELRRDGWEVANLVGSILAWTHQDLDLESDGEPTRRVHVYGSKWDLAADGYESVW